MIERPDWDDYFMAIARVIAKRSIDESTKVGCVVTYDRSIISTGYNSPPRGMVDSKIPQTRPEKYDWMIHAEANAIANAARVGVSMRGSRAYCTDLPCPKCMGLLINAGCTHVFFSNIRAKMSDDKSQEVAVLMARTAEVKLYKWEKE